MRVVEDMIIASIQFTLTLFLGVMTIIALSSLPALLVWFIWNSLAPIYLSAYIPAVFIAIPFLHIWGTLIFFNILFSNLKAK